MPRTTVPMTASTTTHPTTTRPTTTRPTTTFITSTLGLALLAGMLTHPGAAQAASPAPVAETLPPFHAITISPLIGLHFTQGPTQNVSVTAPAPVLRHLRLSVHDGVLDVHTEGDLDDFSMNGHSILLTITLPHLTRIDDSGLVHGTLDHLDAQNLTLNLSGAAELALQGQIHNLTVTISGDSRIDARQLKIDNFTAHISGIGKIKANVTKSVTIDLSGVGHVTIHGNPPVRHIHTSGLGTVNFKP